MKVKQESVRLEKLRRSQGKRIGCHASQMQEDEIRKIVEWRRQEKEGQTDQTKNTRAD